MSHTTATPQRNCAFLLWLFRNQTFSDARRKDRGTGGLHEAIAKRDCRCGRGDKRVKTRNKMMLVLGGVYTPLHFLR